MYSQILPWFQGVIVYLTLYRKNNWLGKGDGNNLKEYYDSLTSAADLSRRTQLDYDEWFKKHHGDKSKYTSKQSHKIWLRHNYAKIFQGLVVRDDVHAKMNITKIYPNSLYKNPKESPTSI